MPDEGLGSAKIPIRPDLEGLDAELEKARGKIEGKLSGVFSKLGGTLAKVGKAAVVGGLGAIVAGTLAIGGAGLASAMQFDEAFDAIQMKTGATGDVLTRLQGDAKKIFRELPVDIGAAADVVGTLNQRLGVTGTVAQDVGKRLLMMGTGDAARSTELYTRVLGDWSIRNEDAAGTLDKLFKASQLTGIGVDDLMAKVVQFGSPLRLMGFSLEESAAMFGKWEKEGVNAELVMGSLRIAAGKFAKEGVPLQKGLKDTIAEIQNMDDASAALSLGMEIFGARAGPDMTAAIREGRFAIDDLTKAMGDSENAILSTAEATMDWPEKFQIIKNKVQTALVPIGGVIMDSLGGAMDKLLPLVETTLLPLLEERIVPAVETLGTALGQVMSGDLAGGLATLFGEDTASQITEIADQIGGFIEQVGGLEPVLQTLGIIVGGVLVAAFIAWAAAAWAAVAPMLPIYAAVAAVVAIVAVAALAWQNDWGGIRTFITDLWTNTLQPIFTTLVEWLQVNIPLALAALSAFWTGTLLPAINTVWAFIEQNIVPLFIAIVEVYIAAFSLALTALAGLWQNVLLPALQAAAGFITDTVVPALTEAWSWLSEKLSPAVETVKGWFDKLKDSSGGLTTVITTVTDKIRGLAEKLGAIKLPDWLTPGSPTPFEWGLRGISAALGPVIDRMMDFARSIGGPQAQAMKNVASAFKDMAKGIDEIAGAMSKIGAFQGGGGGGGAGGFSAMLDQFAVIATEAAARIDAITSAIGYNRIHKLKLTAGRMKDILGAVLVDLSGITEREFPDLEVWFNQFQDVIQRAMVALNAIYGKYGLAVIERAAAIATALATVLGLLGVDLASIIPPPPNFEMLLGAFLAALMISADDMITWLRELTATFSGPVLTAASETAEKLGAIIGVLSLASILASLGKEDTTPGAGLLGFVQSILDGLTGALDILVPGLDAILTKWGDALERVAGISELIKRVFSGVSDAQAAALEFTKAGEIDLGALMRKIGTLSAATGAAVNGLMAPQPAGAAGGAGGGNVTVNIYGASGALEQSYTQNWNDAGQVDIRLGEAMSAS